ncbi:uncharacterized protein VTP21DRAFT_5305 [Calcarisporiella thermophila]|uniref:uncharacterized protein n=1 Tax=Calcarisporiella thermophila TaxID=911321 RepID=UPI0037448686
MSFPNAPFYIQLREKDLVLDVQNASSEPGANIILWNRKSENNANQQWRYENGKLINLQSNLALSVPSLQPNVALQQQHPSGDEQNFEFYDYTISSQDNDSLVLGAIAPVEGNQVALVPRNDDDWNQQWELVVA